MWIWDHFFPPIYGEPAEPHFEGWSLLAAMAAETHRSTIGMLVSCITYRNPNLLADMARTVDHLSGGRLVLGLGSGWFERDYEEYGYEYGTTASRARALRAAIPVIRERLARLVPPALGPLPILVGGVGPEITLPTVAAMADAWNGSGPPELYAALNERLDECCAEIGRDPASVERTVALNPKLLDRWEEYVEGGAEHLIVMVPWPYDLEPFCRVRKAATA
jgi:probable F420-dependent oxidoreductase